MKREASDFAGGALIGKIKEWTLAYIDYKKMPSLAGSESGKGGYKESLILVLLSQALNALAFMISFPLSLYFAAMPFSMEQLFTSLLVLSFIGVVSFYVIGLTIYLVGILLGGKGTPDNLVYLLSVMNMCSRVITVPFVILSAVEPISFFMLIVVSLIGAYGIYAAYAAVKSALSLSPMRTIASLLASMLVVVLVISILGLSAGQV